MNTDNRFYFLMAVRLFISILPLVWGFHTIAFCMCAYNCTVLTLGRGVRGGIASYAYCVLLALLLSAVGGLGLEQSVPFAFELVLAILFCTYAYVSLRPLEVTVALTATAYGLGEMIKSGFEAQKEGQSVVEHKLAEIASLYQTSASTEVGTEAEAANAMMEHIAALFARLSPAMLMILSITAGYAVIWLCEKSLRYTPISKASSFACLRLSKVGVVFGAVMLALCFAPNDKVATVALNCFVVFLFFAFCAGMSLVDFLLRRKISVTGNRICAHFLILTTGMLVGTALPLVNIFFAYIIAGIADSFVSFRKRTVKRHE